MCRGAEMGTSLPAVELATCLSGQICESCPAGSFFNPTIYEVAVCTACPAGSFTSSSGLAVCTACAAGTYSAALGSVTCPPCPEGFSSVAGVSSCVDLSSRSGELVFMRDCSVAYSNSSDTVTLSPSGLTTLQFVLDADQGDLSLGNSLEVASCSLADCSQRTALQDVFGSSARRGAFRVTSGWVMLQTSRAESSCEGLSEGQLRFVVNWGPGTYGACGDAILDTGEACDDGNTVAGDGCSPSCQVISPQHSSLNPIP